MDIQLSAEQVMELASVLDAALRDLSHEIAATDNADYRKMLRQRRELLKSIQGKLNDTSAALHGFPARTS